MPFACPTDGNPLQPVGSEGKDLHACPQCRGGWVDGATLRKLLLERRAQADPGLRLFDERVAGGKPEDRLCPEHGVAMSRFFYRAIELDICPTCHGVWFDAGELKRLTAPMSGSVAAVAAAAAVAGGTATAASLATKTQTTQSNEDSALGGVLDVIGGILDLASLFDAF